MDVFPIRNDGDLQRALVRADALWSAKPGTPDGDELEVWATLIEAYESTHHPMPVGDPIDVIVFKMEELGLTQRELARRLGWKSSGRVSEIINRHRPLTLALVRGISEALGIPSGLLVGETRPDTRPNRMVELSPSARLLLERCAREENQSASEWLENLIESHSSIGRVSTFDQSKFTASSSTGQLVTLRLRVPVGVERASVNSTEPTPAANDNYASAA